MTGRWIEKRDLQNNKEVDVVVYFVTSIFISATTALY